MTTRTETIVLYSLIHNEEYARKALPFVQAEYFEQKKERLIFESIASYFQSYNVPPTSEVISVATSQLTNITEQEEQDILEYIGDMETGLDSEKLGTEWLTDITEKFCKDKALYNAVMTSINIINGDDKKLDRGAMPKILSDALAVSFDTNVGHDYINDTDERYEFYHRKERKVPFDIESFNKITKSGISSKTLSILVGGTGVGKSLIMCHMAAANLSLGNNVLYISLEMSEERIAERIDANLLDVPIAEIEELPKALYDRKVNKLKQNVKGRLMIKEYPTAAASATHFRALLDELKMKKGFTPDIIYVDYLNIASSSRMKASQSMNMYSYVKSIAEELRGIAVEYDVPIFTATQTNRTGFQDMDAGLESTSESFGIAMTGDFILAAISNDEMQEKGVYLFKQLKNRYVDPTFMRRFMVGVDYSKMRLYELENPLDGLYENTKKDDGNSNNKPTFESGKRRRNFGGIKVEDDE